MNRLYALAPLWLLVIGLQPTLAQAPQPVPTALADYIKKPEPDYAWKFISKTDAPAGTVYLLSLTSQRWHDELWTHDLQLFVPTGSGPKSTVALMNTGGNAGGASSAILGMEIATRVNGPVAFLYGIPKQPLFGGKREDALIAETFVRYLADGDSSWPLLFPMAKSVVKSMDAIQAFAKEDWKFEVKDFVIMGASKRGWTSWLTAATGDPRVKAIAPMVIDTLNFPKQMPNQLKSFGRYSEMIHDYEERNLLPMPDTDAARKLWAMVDPWIYREKLTLPKLLVFGTNDPYWAQDALNLYWDDLKGPKFICYVANAGHDLRPQEKPNQPGSKKDPLPLQAVNTLAAYSRIITDGKAMPELSWTKSGDEYTVKSSPAPKQYHVWTTTSPTRDFRKSKWTAETHPGSQSLSTKLAQPAKPKEFAATFIECEFEYGGLKYTLTTQIQIQGD